MSTPLTINSCLLYTSFELRPAGVTLIEIAPGIDLQTQVLDQMEFMPKIADDLKLMDERIFHEGLMGLAND